MFDLTRSHIMTPKARADIHMNLPALQKLDSMLMEPAVELKGQNRTTSESKRWWLPSPQVPKPGLSNSARKKLLDKGKVVYKVFKATKSINENVLLEMPVPAIIKEAIPKTVNKLETAIFSWKERLTEQASNGKSPVRIPWSFTRDPLYETESLLNRAEALRNQIKSKYPNLPNSFLYATKIQYGKNTLKNGRNIEEAAASNPNSPAPPSFFHSSRDLYRTPERPLLSSRVRHSLTDDLNKADGRETGLVFLYGDAKVTTTPSRSSRLWYTRISPPHGRDIL
ncbi:unnamed protein product [Brassica oleracea var. botrytis]